MIDSILTWIPLVFMAIANGALRELTYQKFLGDLRAHQVSTAIGILLFSPYIGAVIYFWHLDSPGEAIALGGVWLGLTLAFEFVFGHYVAHRSWKTLLHDYNIRAGRVWIVLVAWIALAPVFFYWVFSQKFP